MPEQFFHFLISPFSKGRPRGICFSFLPSLWERGKERGGDCIQVYSCILSPSPLSLSHQREKEKNFFKFSPFLKGETGGFIFLLFFFAKISPCPSFKKRGIKKQDTEGFVFPLSPVCGREGRREGVVLIINYQFPIINCHL